MRYILLLVLLVSNVAFANCNSHSASQMVRDVQTSAISKLSKVIGPQFCQVRFNVVIDGVEHTVNYKYDGESEGSKLCGEAMERGKNELMSTLAGKYRTETVTVCKEDNIVNFKPVKIGDSVMENELNRVEKSPEYFTYHNSKCRLFRERFTQKGVFRVTHGVICQSDDNDWIVVDKW